MNENDPFYNIRSMYSECTTPVVIIFKPAFDFIYLILSMKGENPPPPPPPLQRSLISYFLNIIPSKILIGIIRINPLKLFNLKLPPPLLSADMIVPPVADELII